MNITDLCNTAQYLADSDYFRVMLIIRLIIAVSGVVLFALLLKIQGTNLAIHSSARVLLISHHVWAILQLLANVLAHTYSLIRLSPVHVDPCDYLLTTLTAVLIRGLDVFTLYGQVWAFAAMAVERCVATVRYRNYENQSSTLGQVLVMIQWFLTIIWFYLLVEKLNWSEMKAHSNVSSPRTSIIHANLLWILAGTELLSLLLFLALLFYNKHKKVQIVGEASLTEKYQLDENMRAIRLMIPLILTHFACFMPTLVMFPIYINFLNPKGDPGAYAIFLESVNFIAFYPFLLPIILFWRHKKLRENMRRTMALDRNQIFPHVGPPLPIERTAEQIHHFENLKLSWSSSAKRK